MAKQKNKLKEKNIQFMSNLVYNLDLAPCGFFLLAKIRHQLRGQRFSSPEEAVEELRLVFRDDAPPLATVYNRFHEFKCDRTNETDDLSEGHPSKMTTENISVIRLMIETDKRVTYQRIWTNLGIGMS
ncbi:hypothetical protein EVAR_45680_1 [Eumeta japonica]|uniref:Mos1 transposase HTH domain-containing protein n=1 Tax=Eumeta variegata TaxID=151549 RepID=A0A4C1XK80_EUMVA|nr:hypothetical protein EVAR_45680_1 [Eumeta japonica]